MRGCFLKKDKRAKPEKEDASVTAMLTAIRDKAGGRSREGPFPKMWPLVNRRALKGPAATAVHMAVRVGSIQPAGSQRLNRDGRAHGHSWTPAKWP